MTAPAPANAYSPTVTPQITVAFAPIQAPFLIRVGTKGVFFRLIGKRSFVKTTLGPTKTSSSIVTRSEEHTSELQSLRHLVCRLLLEKKKIKNDAHHRADPYYGTKDHK